MAPCHPFELTLMQYACKKLSFRRVASAISSVKVELLNPIKSCSNEIFDAIAAKYHTSF